MTQKRVSEIRAKVAQKKSGAKITILPELRKLVIDTSKLKNQKSSTEILQELRYQVK